MSRTAAPAPSQTRLALGQVARALAEAGRRLLALLAPLGRRLLRLVSHAYEAVSPFGRIVVLATAAAAIAGLLLGWVELLFLAATLAAALAIGVGFSLGRASYAVTLELDPRRVVAGERAMGRMLVVNSGRRRLLPTRMELPVGEGVAEFHIPRLAPEGESEELFAVPTSRRAVILAGPALSVRGDQLGLVRRTMAWTDRIELFVHPKTTRLKASAHGLVRDLEGKPTNVITNSDLAFHALRPYEDGDDMRNVHWRTSARTGQLMVRQYQETRRSQLLLLHSAESSHYASDDEFELAVSLMASLGCHVIGDGNAIHVAWDRGPLRVRTPVALLDDSCRLERVNGEHRSLRDLARHAGARLPDPSLVVLVVGSLVDFAQLRSVTTLYGNDTEVLALRAAPGSNPRIGRAGDVGVATVGELNHLPSLLQRLGR